MINTKFTLFLVIVTTFLISACTSATGNNISPNGDLAPNSTRAVAGNSRLSNTVATPVAPTTAIKTGTGHCGEQKLAGKRFIRSQTFPINFKPFEGSCFVTFGSEEDMLDANDLPRGSTFYIYKDGKQTFEFPDAFGGQSACWIDAVSFKDLNNDDLTDIVLAGSCLAAKDSYPSNAVYVNTGTSFTTSETANLKLENLRSIRDIESFVRKNIKSFF